MFLRRLTGHQICVSVIGAFALAVLSAADVWAQSGRTDVLSGLVRVFLLPRVWLGAIFCLTGLALLMKQWVPKNLRLGLLVLIVLVFGVLMVLPLGNFARGMGLHPSPVCSITRPFQFLNAGRSVPTIFLGILLFISVFSVVGNKLFCGWVCPVGAVQELCNRIPLREGMKLKLRFSLSNAVRALVFVLFVVVVFLAGINIYDFFNPFEFFHWRFGLLAVTSLVTVSVASLFIFRPFCYLVCPIGLFTWILEHLSLVRVKFAREKCSDCGICVKASPCPAVTSIIEGKRSRPDCHACGRCVAECPESALRFRL